MKQINDEERLIVHPGIRKATQPDAREVASTYKRSFSEHIMVQRGLLSDPQYLAEQFCDENQVWVVHDCGSGVQGVAALQIIPLVGLAEIERVCVDLPHRGKGIAYQLCAALTQEAEKRSIGFLEAFARGQQPAMQRTFEKLGFKVYGVSPRFEIVHDGVVQRELFVHMGKELTDLIADKEGTQLIPAATRVFNTIHGI